MKVYSNKQLKEFEEQRKKHAKKNEELEEQRTFFSKLGAFFVYYKYHFLILGFFFISGIYLIFTTVFSDKPDYELVIAAKQSQTSVDIAVLNEELQKYGEDLNGDGKVLINITNCIVDGDVDDLQTAANMTTIFISEVETTQKIFYLVDDTRLREMKNMLSDEKDPIIPINSKEEQSWEGTKLQKNTESGLGGNFYFLVRNANDKSEKHQQYEKAVFDFINRVTNNK